MRILRRYILLTVAALMLSGCFFTGVEGTKTIRDSQTTTRADVSETDPLDTIAPPVFSRWSPGQEFYVIDSQINLLLASAASTLRLEVGDTLHYISAEAENIYGTKPLAFVNFGTRGGATVRLKSGMTMDALRAAHQLPFMVALSVVEQVRAEIVGQELFTTTAQWYDINGDAAQGIKYAKVRVIDIQPGNKVYSLKVLFQYEGKNYFQYVSAGNDAVANRRFSNQFARQDPHLDYPNISDAHWAMIQRGTISDDMSRDECRLALGAPASINKAPSYEGLREVWQYSDGRYLIFIDGVLTDYRK